MPSIEFTKAELETLVTGLHPRSVPVASKDERWEVFKENERSAQAKVIGALRETSLSEGCERREVKPVSADEVCGILKGYEMPPELVDDPLQVIVDFLDAWRFCPVSEASNPARSCIENAARQLLTTLTQQSSTTSSSLSREPADREKGLQRFRYEGGDLNYEPRHSAPDDWDGNLGDLIGDYFRAEDVEGRFTQQKEPENSGGVEEAEAFSVTAEERGALVLAVDTAIADQSVPDSLRRTLLGLAAKLPIDAPNQHPSLQVEEGDDA